VARLNLTFKRRLTNCDPKLPTVLSPVPHDYVHVDDEYDSLANGGNYEILICKRCGRKAYSPMPD
jgi:hypothetical protein